MMKILNIIKKRFQLVTFPEFCIDLKCYTVEKRMIANYVLIIVIYNHTM